MIDLFRHNFRSLRFGWTARCIVKSLGFLNTFVKIRQLKTIEIQLLNSLNMRGRLDLVCREILTRDHEFWSDQNLIHAALKSAWSLRDAELISSILERISIFELSDANLLFIYMRKTNFAGFHGITEQVVKNKLDLLERCDLTGQNGRYLLSSLRVLRHFDLTPSLQERLQSGSTTFEALYFLAEQSAKSEKLYDSITYLEKASQIDPSNAQIYDRLGHFHLNDPDPMSKLVDLTRRKAAHCPGHKGYDVLQSYCNLVADDMLAFLKQRADQGSTIGAHVAFGSTKTAQIGTRAGPLERSEHSLFVIGRDGVSDEIRWSYYYSALPDCYGKVSISCDPRLLNLFKASFPRIEFHPVDRIWERIWPKGSISRRDIVPNSALAAKLNDKAYEIAKSHNEILFNEDVAARDWITRGLKDPPAYGEPSGATLISDPKRKKHWQNQLSSQSPKRLKVGITWRSGLTDLERQTHFLDLRDFSAIGGLPISLFALENVLTEDEQKTAEEIGITIPDIDFYNDFDEIAAFSSELDLVVGISTLPYELAAAVGTQSWLCAISPLGRWMRLGHGSTEVDKITRNGRVFVPKSKNGYFAPKSERIANIMEQIKTCLENETQGKNFR